MTDNIKYSELYSHQDGLYSNMLKLTIINYRLFATILIGGVIINYITDDDMRRTMMTYFGISFWTYAVHLFMHKYENTILGKIHAIHHTSEYKDYISTEIFEIIVNLTVLGGLGWIPLIMVTETYTGIQIANHYVILIWSIIFTTYHLINYHILSHAVHVQHHVDKGVNNYGPEWFDIICNTKAEDSEIEDMNSVIINTIVITAIVLFLKDTPYDVVDLFSYMVKYEWIV